MIKQTKRVLLFGMVLNACLNLYSQGYLVVNGVYPDPTFLSGNWFAVVYDPGDMRATGFTFDPAGKTSSSLAYDNIFTYDSIADVGVRTFKVFSGNPITAATVLGGNYQEYSPYSSSGYVFTPNVPVYVAIYTGNQPYAPTNGVYSDPLFGWAELKNVQGKMQLIDSALEYQGGGIITGTQTIVPEPETWALLLCGAGLLGVIVSGAKRRRSASQQ